MCLTAFQVAHGAILLAFDLNFDWHFNGAT
jgi:hypothetical protein